MKKPAEKSHRILDNKKERVSLFFEIGMLTLGPKPTAYNPNRDASTQNLSGVPMLIFKKQAGIHYLLRWQTTLE